MTHSPGPEGDDTASRRQRVFTTDELFGGAVEIGISHRGETYRLRITRQGKLVLNK